MLRTFKGIEVNDESLSFDVIKDVVYGEGHYLRHEQTFRLMHSEFEYPDIADRSTSAEWEVGSSIDARQLAAQRTEEMLSSHYPEYIDSIVGKKVRKDRKILLRGERIKPG